jgi:hypothetical protein
VEHAGLQSIAPTAETLRITQLRLRCEERARLYTVLRSRDLPARQALGLLGAPARLLEKSVVRRRGYRRRLAVSRRVSTRKTTAAPLKIGDRVWANWWELGDYYPGVITKIQGEHVHVRYDDGDEEQVHLRNIRREPPD